ALNAILGFHPLDVHEHGPRSHWRFKERLTLKGRMRRDVEKGRERRQDVQGGDGCFYVSCLEFGGVMNQERYPKLRVVKTATVGHHPMSPKELPMIRRDYEDGVF